jgi:hypothetical protein
MGLHVEKDKANSGKASSPKMVVEAVLSTERAIPWWKGNADEQLLAIGRPPKPSNDARALHTGR